MIELLGIGAEDAGEAPLLRRVCVRLERTGEVIAVLASRSVESQALLDVISGRRVPDEGRSWVDGVPLMRQTAARVQAIMADASPAAWLAERRSLLWNTLRTPRTVLGGLLRIPRPAERAAAIEALTAVRLEHRARDIVAALSPSERARVVLARALARRPRVVVMRDVNDGRLERNSIPFRYVWPSELDLMAQLAGMSVRERWAGWTREPFASDSRKHVPVGEKRP